MIREESEEAPANWQGHGPLTQLQESIEGKDMDRAGDKNYKNRLGEKKGNAEQYRNIHCICLFRTGVLLSLFQDQRCS